MNIKTKGKIWGYFYIRDCWGSWLQLAAVIQPLSYNTSHLLTGQSAAVEMHSRRYKNAPLLLVPVWLIIVMIPIQCLLNGVHSFDWFSWNFQLIRETLVYPYLESAPGVTITLPADSSDLNCRPTSTTRFLLCYGMGCVLCILYYCKFIEHLVLQEVNGVN